MITDQYKNSFLKGEHLLFLDGLRGIASILVLIYHISWMWRKITAKYYFKLDYFIAQIGWTGVNLFFIVSGLLITNILLNTKNKNNYFKNFYMRRVLRIIPLYFLILFIFNFLYNEFSHLFFHLFFISNFLLVDSSIVNSGFAAVSWSLSIEEQFYIFWPMIIRTVSSNKLYIYCILIIGVATTIKSMSFLGNLPYHFLYYSTVTRLDGLALGSLLALIIRFRTSRRMDFYCALFVLSLSLSLIIFIYLKLGGFYVKINPTLIMGLGDILVNLFYASFIYITIFWNKGYLRKILTCRLLSISGKHSYAIYLIHPVVLSLVDNFLKFKIIKMAHWNFLLTEISFHLLVIIITFIVAKILWVSFEAPFLNLKRFFDFSPT